MFLIMFFLSICYEEERVGIREREREREIEREREGNVIATNLA